LPSALRAITHPREDGAVESPVAQEIYDVSIIGAGPAGLAAALLLGRCRRRVFLCDSGKPRNASSKAVHGFLSRDGIAPQELRRIAREELRGYPGVRFQPEEAVDARHVEGGFEVCLASGTCVRSEVLLLATGKVDVLPDIPGAREYYGRGVFHCPYCDGWEHQGRPWVAYGKGKASCDYALEMLTWTRNVTLCSDGPAELGADELRRLAIHRIQVEERSIRELTGDADHLQRLVFADGGNLTCQAFFFNGGELQHSALAQKLGAQLDRTQSICCDDLQASGVPRLFVAGNASSGLQLAILAAAEGTRAGYIIHSSLHERSLHQREQPHQGAR
jgi:thioredoxin reductase